MFYPKGMRSADYLTFYAEHFHTVEVDSTFYGCPSARPVEQLGSSDYSFRRLASHFSRIALLGGSIVVKATPIPEFGLEWTTLPKAARLVPPWIILSETFVPSGNGLDVYT